MNSLDIDKTKEKPYNEMKMDIVKLLKHKALILSQIYNRNLHIEIDTNPNQRNAAVKITEINV